MTCPPVDERLGNLVATALPWTVSGRGREEEAEGTVMVPPVTTADEEETTEDEEEESNGVEVVEVIGGACG